MAPVQSSWRIGATTSLTGLIAGFPGVSRFCIVLSIRNRLAVYTHGEIDKEFPKSFIAYKENEASVIRSSYSAWPTKNFLSNTKESGFVSYEVTSVKASKKILRITLN